MRLLAESLSCSFNSEASNMPGLEIGVSGFIGFLTPLIAWPSLYLAWRILSRKTRLGVFDHGLALCLSQQVLFT